MQLITRRMMFSKVLGVAVGGVSLFSMSSVEAAAKKKKKKKKGGGDDSGAELVSFDDQMAKNVGLNEKSKIKDASLKTARQGCSFDKQKCENCILYKNMDKKIDGAAVGSCTLFAGKAVKNDWWCKSWSKGPAAKC